MDVRLPELPEWALHGAHLRLKPAGLKTRLEAYARAAVALNKPAVDGWRPIESAPEGQLFVVGWNECDGGPPACLEFDCKEDGVWMNHADNLEHAEAAAPPGSRMPGREAPYQWWLPIPQLPNTAALGGSNG